MKAVCINKYGPPEVLAIGDMPMPVPGPRDVIVRQVTSLVSPANCAMRSADPFLIRLFEGLRAPRNPIPGGAIAGVVHEVGAEVRRFRAGDRVFGTIDPNSGALAEYVRVAEDGALAIMPETMRFEEAGGITYSYLTAMPFLRDEAKLTAGQTILINGAAGSVGTIAVQLARNIGAHVTAVCSTRNIELVRALGAAEVIDRTVSDFTTADARYDVIFDAVGKSSFAACRQALKPGGIYLTTAPSLSILWDMLRGRRADGKRAKLATTGLRKTPDKRRDVEELQGMMARGELRTVIERIYPMDEIVAAHRHVERGTKAGDVIIAIAEESLA
jgi:NADPH:quinone reductase-like Zn-dependent oxidoreductase